MKKKAMNKNIKNKKNEYDIDKEVEIFFSMAKQEIPHASKTSLRAVLEKLPSVTLDGSSRYTSRDEAKGFISPFTKLLTNKEFGKVVRSPWMISGVGIATIFIVFVTSGVATTNTDLTRLTDNSYSLRKDIVFSTSSNIGDTDILFVADELSTYASYAPVDDSQSADILSASTDDLVQLSKISYEI